MKEPSPYEILQKIDDARLDVSAHRLLVHYWRVGVCWETVQTTHEKTGMSVGSVHKWRNWLVDNGYIELAPKVTQNGTFMGYQLRLEAFFGDSCTRSRSESVQQCTNSLCEQVQQYSVADVHQMNGNIHEVNALPLSMLNEDSLSKSDGVPPKVDVLTEEQLAKKRATEATLTLSEFWQELTAQDRPGDEREFREDWFQPLNKIWILCGRDIDAAKGRVQLVRDGMIGRGLSLTKPKTLLRHVKTQIDAELLPMTTRMNGRGHVPQPSPAVTMKEHAPGLY